jgi:hypothetical protein
MTTHDHSPAALVTGGSRGLGRATALALAAAGVDVVITYRSSEQKAREVVAELESLGRRGTALQLDTTDIASFGAFADELRQALPHGVIDIPVNNAGTALYSALQSTTEGDFDRIFAVHVKGPFFLTQTLVPLLADGGRIVNVSTALQPLRTVRALRRPAAENACPSRPQLITRSGTIRTHASPVPSDPNCSPPPASCNSAVPRTSSPRGVHGSVLTRSSITIATFGLAFRSRYFLDATRS